jgi:hypothetical protein
MDVSRYNYSESLTIQRSAAELYAIVSDVSRMGDLSPVSQAGAWDDPARAGQEGAWFTGHNAVGDVTWDTRCKVVVSKPGREFTFINFGPVGDVELVRWGFTFEEEPDGTNVTESWQVLPAYPEFVRHGNETMDVKARIDGMEVMAKEGIGTTLANLKRLAES